MTGGGDHFLHRCKLHLQGWRAHQAQPPETLRVFELATSALCQMSPDPLEADFIFVCPSSLRHGQTATVAGPADRDADERIAVAFPGHKNDTDVLISELSRQPPKPLPGGYKDDLPGFLFERSLCLDSDSRLLVSLDLLDPTSAKMCATTVQRSPLWTASLLTGSPLLTCSR